MWKEIKAGGLAAAVLFAADIAGAEEVRQIKVVEDRDQTRMTSKVYELKHVKAVDLAPFVLGAVKRYHAESSVDRLSHSEGGREYLAVNMPVKLVPHMDDMVAKLDKAGKADDSGSVLEGTGITRYVFCPKYRASSEMESVGATISNGDGSYFFDAASTYIYWKDSKSYSDSSRKWLEALDRPVPQVQLSINVYEVNENDLKELGIDYVAWKNGPGANIFNAGYDYLNSRSFSEAGNWSNALDISNVASHSWAGFMVAPNIDMTFIRLLAQKGKARIATSGTLTVVNDFTSPDPGTGNYDGAKYKIRFTPSYQNIQKDSDQNTSVSSADSDYYFYLRLPIINFNDKGDQTAALNFGWVLNITDTVEKINSGAPVQNTKEFHSWLTLNAGAEKLLASYTREHSVGQENGMPLLGDIPGLKYLFGASNDSKSSSKVFVTVKAEPMTPDSSLSKWAGRIVTATEILNGSKRQIYCPIMKDRVDKVERKLFVDYGGKRIYVCCTRCLAVVQKDPEKYIKELEAEGIYLDKTPEKESKKAVPAPAAEPAKENKE